MTFIIGLEGCLHISWTASEHMSEAATLTRYEQVCVQL